MRGAALARNIASLVARGDYKCFSPCCAYARADSVKCPALAPHPVCMHASRSRGGVLGTAAWHNSLLSYVLPRRGAGTRAKGGAHLALGHREVVRRGRRARRCVVRDGGDPQRLSSSFTNTGREGREGREGLRNVKKQHGVEPSSVHFCVLCFGLFFILFFMQDPPSSLCAFWGLDGDAWRGRKLGCKAAARQQASGPGQSSKTSRSSTELCP